VEAAAPGGRETILLVEDSDSLRAMIREVLEASGYVVVEADTPEASLTAVRDPGPAIDLLVTDVIMPGLSGPTSRSGCARRIRGPASCTSPGTRTR
jgi:two-component system cell cycle sensor histidine kinase/response regulator CckA